MGIAQQPGTTSNEADYHSSASLEEQASKLAEQARMGSGVATLPLEKYGNSNTSLTVRTKSGGGEMHGAWADLFVALDGEANVITGGTLVDRKDLPAGESRGSGVEGGTVHTMHKGDVLHISPGVAHQTKVPEGKTFTYFVVKIAAK
jgi:hypothetical protein